MKIILIKKPRISMKFDMFLNAYRIFQLVFLLVMFSCTEKDGEGLGPTIQLIQENGYISSDTSISPGQMMHFAIEANKGDFDITQFLIQVKGDTIQTWFDTGLYTPQLKWYGSFTKSFNDDEEWEFIVRDRFSHSISTTILITNDSLQSHGEIETYSQIELGAQNNMLLGGFFSLFNQLTYEPEEAKANQEIIDMVFYFGEDEHTMASPGANIEDGIFEENLSPIDWDIRNTTRYLKTELSNAEFDAIVNDSVLLVSYIEGEGKRKAKNLADGGVFSFKTQDSKFGLFKVNEVIDTEEGNINIDIKIQH